MYEPRQNAVSSIDLDAALSSFFPGILTKWEIEIVGLVLGGHTNKSIASHLGITTGGVRNHRVRLYEKLDVTVERELFKLFLDHLLHL